MKTSNTQANFELAAELLNTRLKLRELEKREKELKEYFTAILGSDNSLSIGNEFTIIQTESKRKSYSKDLLDMYFISKKVDCDAFKIESSFNILKITKI